ncbi:MAG: rhomboid family intramembrane serine protease [Solobacterium sp.]|nr:rhomboid family intramembrane serine protease [Solobacterium sp.]
MTLKTLFKEIPGTCIVITICIIVFLMINLGVFPGLSTTGHAILLGCYYKPFILAGEWWRLITVGFVHISFFHCFMNLYAFFQMGISLENHYGTRNFLLLLFLSVLGGSLFMMIRQGNVPIAVGLSGGLYGCMAAMVMLMIRSGYLNNPRIRNSLIHTFAINLMINFMPNVGYMAHLGGFVVGFILSIALEPKAGDRTLAINSLVASIALLGILGYYCFTRVDMGQTQHYYGTDLEVLAYEKGLGLNDYADHMSLKLNELYKNTIITDTLEAVK